MSVMGDDDDFEVVGYEDDEVEGAILGVAPRAGRMVRRARAVHMVKPAWRSQQLAPGVNTRQEGLIPLPMSPQNANGVFALGVPTITWQGSLQKPFRGERLLVTSVRTGASATGRLLGQLFVGTDLQAADITGFDIETVGSPTAFGTRLTMVQAPPGVLIRLLVTISSVPTTTDTVAVFVTINGRVVH